MSHDLSDFIVSAQRTIAEEYIRIQKRATEDPGTAGDQGEENWATLLKQWLPPYFHIVTKGRILTAEEYTSPQIDVLVLKPSYPKILLDKKLYLAGGVAAAFECKTTLKSQHVEAAVKTAASLHRNLPVWEGSPYKELHSPIIYGLLAHSHSWKGKKSTPIENIKESLIHADKDWVRHPRESLDYICVADLATWSISKLSYMSPQMLGNNDDLASLRAQFLELYGEDGSATTSYVSHIIDPNQNIPYSPIGYLLSNLMLDFSWTFQEMRTMAEYFQKVEARGISKGAIRPWASSIVYSTTVRDRLASGGLKSGQRYDEWSPCF